LSEGQAEGMQELKQMISELKDSVDSGFGDMARRLIDLDCKTSDGLASVRDALESSNESVREGVNELRQALNASEQKLVKQLDKATLTNIEVVKGVKAELGLLSNRLEALPLESLEALESLCGAVDDIKSGLEKDAKAAKNDQEALRAVLSEAVSAVQVMSSKVDALQAQVSELSIQLAKQSEDIILQIRRGDEATKQALTQAQSCFEAVLTQALGNAAAGSEEALRAALHVQREQLLQALAELQLGNKEEVRKMNLS